MWSALWRGQPKDKARSGSLCCKKLPERRAWAGTAAAVVVAASVVLLLVFAFGPPGPQPRQVPGSAAAALAATAGRAAAAPKPKLLAEKQPARTHTRPLDSKAAAVRAAQAAKAAARAEAEAGKAAAAAPKKPKRLHVRRSAPDKQLSRLYVRPEPTQGKYYYAGVEGDFLTQRLYFMRSLHMARLYNLTYVLPQWYLDCEWQRPPGLMACVPWDMRD